jgi:hypothetical protein
MHWIFILFQWMRTKYKCKQGKEKPALPITLANDVYANRMVACFWASHNSYYFF